MKTSVRIVLPILFVGTFLLPAVSEAQIIHDETTAAQDDANVKARLQAHDAGLQQRANTNGISTAEQADIDKWSADYKAQLDAANQGKVLDAPKDGSAASGDPAAAGTDAKGTDASGGGGAASGDGNGSASSESSDSGPVEIDVTENVPGADCVYKEGIGDPSKKKYTCTVPTGFTMVMGFLGGLIRYATYITALIGVLMIVYSGLAIVATAGSDKERAAAKARIAQLVAGLALLYLVSFVLNTIAPWIYK